MKKYLISSIWLLAIMALFAVSGYDKNEFQVQAVDGEKTLVQESQVVLSLAGQ